jgi:hypothetical protein
VRMAAIEIHRVALAQREILALEIDHQLAAQNVDDFRAGMLVRLRRLFLRFDFDIVTIQLALAHRIVERLEMIGGRRTPRLVGQTDALALANDRVDRPVAVLLEEVIKADAENQRDGVGATYAPWSACANWGKRRPRKGCNKFTYRIGKVCVRASEFTAYDIKLLEHARPMVS